MKTMEKDKKATCLGDLVTSACITISGSGIVYVCKCDEWSNYSIWNDGIMVGSLKNSSKTKKSVTITRWLHGLIFTTEIRLNDITVFGTKKRSSLS